MENGALIFTDVMGPVVNAWTRLTWTHTLIYLNGWYYESTWPKVKRSKFFHAKSHAIVQPSDPFNATQLANMESYAYRQLGNPYGLRAYFRPRLLQRPGRITYCSQFVCYTLGRAIEIPYGEGHTPDSLLRWVITSEVYT